MRVKLLKSLCEELPVGSLGEAMFLKSCELPKGDMVRVQWDNGMNIPMYRNEIEPAATP
jgi:hypothetical protein